jgi:hypothetical protein
LYKFELCDACAGLEFAVVRCSCAVRTNELSLLYKLPDMMGPIQ